MKTYGFIYCTSEDNSVNTVKNAKEYCDSNNIKYEEVSVTSSSDVEQAIKSLTDKGVDAVFIPNDSVVMSAMSVVTEVARDKKIPVYGSSATMVDAGCFATIAISDKVLKRQKSANSTIQKVLIRHVPFKEKDKVYKEYHEAIDAAYEKLHATNAKRHKIGNMPGLLRGS